MRSSRTTSRQRPPARGDRARSEQRGDRRGAEHERDAPRIVGRAGRAQREVEHGFGFADAAEAREDPGAHLVRLRLAGAVAQRFEASRRPRSRPRRRRAARAGSVSPISCASKHAAHAPSWAFEPASARSSSTSGAPRHDVARREQALARDDQELGAARGFGRREARRARAAPASRPSRGRRARARVARRPTAARRRGRRAGRCRRRRVPSSLRYW